VRRRRRALCAALALFGAACTEQIQSTTGPTTPITSSTQPGASSLVTTPSTAPPTSGPTTTTTSTTTTSTTSTTTTSTTSTTVVPTTTACEKVVHIGDSTSVPLFDPASVGGANLTASARYQAVGVTEVYPDSDGARSMVERINGAPNAIDVAQAVRDNGYVGCWVMMIGTNDAANIAAGSNVTAESRIRAMMQVVADDPVLWVDAVTQRTDDAYRNASMLAWNQELYRVTAEYPNVRVFRWYDVVQPQWFRNDGIHYTIEGNAQRAALTAQALVTFFPAAP
jgi:hypothetical protein